MDMVNKVAHTWHTTKRSGDTGIGYTFETLMGIKANSADIPDFRGIEIKSFRNRRSSRKISLFSKVPDSYGHGGSFGLWRDYGYGEGDEKRL